VFAAFVACGKEKAALKDSVPVATSTSPATPAAGAPDCPRTGHWTVCQLRKRLEQAGLAPRDTTTIGDLPSLDVKPTLLMLGNAGLAYYLFADTTARNRAAATLDTSRYIVQTKPLSMRNEATRIENDNALAILLSRNEHQRERVADAITAGPPQP
jgi:hypothetical protein